MAITAETRTDIIDLVVAALDVAPGTELLNELVTLVDGGGSLADVAANLTARADYKAKYPTFQTANEWATEWLGNLIPEASAESMAEAITVAEGMINAGSSQAAIIQEAATFLTANTADATWGTISTAFVNNSEVAAYYTVTVEKAAIGTDTLVGVDSTSASVTTAKTAVDTIATPGTTTALTTGLDTGASFTGGTGDDTFTADATSAATTNTFTTGDSITGGAGTDRLTVAISNDATTPSALVATSGVEELSIFNNDSGGFTIQGDLMDGLTDIYVTSGQDAITVDQLNSTPNLHLTSTNKDATLTATTATVAGTADAITMASNGVASTANVTATFNGIETINLAGSGAATGSATSALTVASDSLETVNLTGSTNMYVVADLTGADNTGEVATFNASAATGNIDATLTAGGSTEMSVTMGSGDDTITLGAMDKDYTVDGGAGSDTIETSAAAYSTATATADLVGVGVTNVEVLGLTASGSADLRAFPNNTFTSLTAAGTATFTGLPSTATTLTTSDTGSLSIDRATDGSTDTATVNLVPATPGTFTSVNVSDEETVTLKSSGVAAGSNTITTLTGTDTTSLTITGDRDLTVTNAVTGTALATLDASGLTGQGTNLSISAANSLVAMTVTAGAGSEASLGETMNTITTGSGADTITGGAYKDVITSGSGSDSVTAGAGDDTITTTFGNDYVDGGAGNDTITDSVGNDTLIGGDGNDTISTAAGADSVSGGAGNDKIYVTTLGANDTIDGGAGTDALSLSATSTTLAASFYSDVTESTALNLTGVESAYIQVTTAAANTTSAPLNLDFTSVTGLSTLYLDTVSADAEAYKITNFGGSSLILSELAAGQDPESINIDGADQASLTVSVRGLKPDTADQIDSTVTGVTALTISGDSYVSTTAQSNELGQITANSVDTITISTTGTGGYAANANALLLEGVSADNAQTLTIDVGAGDTLTSDEDIDTGNSIAQTVGVTIGENSTLTISGGDLDLGSSAVNTLTLTSGIGATISTLDIAATSVADFNGTLSASSTNALDLDFAITDGDVTMSTGSTWTLATAGAASAASDLVITGYGSISGAGALAGSTFTFDASGLTDSNGLTVTGASLSGVATLKGSTGADTITGSPQADAITGGNGADSITGGSAADTITLTENVSAADDVVYAGTTASAIATETGAATGDTDFVAGTSGDKIVGFTSGSDDFSFAAALLTNQIGTEADTLVTIAAAGIVPNTARFVEITTAFDGTTGDAITDLNALTTSAITNAANDAFVAFMNDGTDGYLFLVEQISAADTIAAQDVTLIGKVMGVTDVANGDFISG